MPSPLAALSLFVSLALLAVGSLGLAEAQGVCGNWCLIGDPIQALISGIGCVLAGAHNLHNATLPGMRAERAARSSSHER